MKILTLQLWALRSSKHSMVVLVLLLLLLLHYLPYMVVVGGRPNSNSNFTTRGTETSDPVPVPFFFFLSDLPACHNSYYSVVLLSVIYFSWFWGFLVLLAFEQASSTLVPPPNPTICISHYTLHITHHTSHIMSSGSREQGASKQTNKRYIAFPPQILLDRREERR